MREHPEYKYRPRRKPKPLVKKDGCSKYGFPLHFFPPGMDPIIAARSFAFSPHYAAALAAATAFGTHSGQAGSILSPNDMMSHFSSIPLTSNAPTKEEAPHNHRLLGGAGTMPSLKDKVIGHSEPCNLPTLHPQYSSLNHHEGFLAFVQKYHEEQNKLILSSQKTATHSKINPVGEDIVANTSHEIQRNTPEERDVDESNEYMDDASDEEEDEFLDVDGNEVDSRQNDQCSQIRIFEQNVTSKISTGMYTNIFVFE